MSRVSWNSSFLSVRKSVVLRLVINTYESNMAACKGDVALDVCKRRMCLPEARGEYRYGVFDKLSAEDKPAMVSVCTKY